MQKRINRMWKRARRWAKGKPWARLWRWGKEPKRIKLRWERFDALGQWAKRRAHHHRDRKQWKRARIFARAADVYFNKKHRLKQRWLEQHKDPTPPPSGAGWTTFDGKPVTKWIAAGSQKVRNAGKWPGAHYSGHRSPELCRQLCEAMCGAPSCPGRCAGTSSNHCDPPSFTGAEFEGAVDSTYAVTFRVECARLGVPLTNHLSLDEPHSSHSGY